MAIKILLSLHASRLLTTKWSPTKALTAMRLHLGETRGRQTPVLDAQGTVLFLGTAKQTEAWIRKLAKPPAWLVEEGAERNLSAEALLCALEIGSIDSREAKLLRRDLAFHEDRVTMLAALDAGAKAHRMTRAAFVDALERGAFEIEIVLAPLALQMAFEAWREGR